MRMSYIIIISIIIVLILVLIPILIFVLPLLKEKKIENINHLRFSYSTGYHMNAYVIYEIDLVDGKYIAKIKPTDIEEEKTKEIEISKEKVKELEKELNKYHVSRWDGFNKSDKNVLDGDSFSISIRMNNDNNISASGYMMWPNNYREVKNYLDTTLGSLYE